MTDLSQLSDAQLQQLLGSSSTVQARPLPALQGTNSHGQPLAGPAYNIDFSKLSDQQLQAAAANADPSMSTAEDMARSGVTGLEKAGTGLAGSVGDVENLWGNGVDWLAHKGIGGLQDFTGSNLGAPYMGGHRTLSDLAPGAARPGDFQSMDYAHYNGHATSADYNKLIQDVAGPYHAPQTAAGRYTERIAEFAPAAMTGHGLGRLGAVVLPGAGSQAAEDMAPDSLKPLAALAGALAGGGANGVIGRLGRAPQAAFGAALGDVTPDQMALAQQLRQGAAARGLQLTVPEAVQQVTNNGTGLGRLQRVVEGTKQGQALTAPYFANRAGQVSQATRSLADAIAPATENPGVVGLAAQRGAEAALKGAAQARTAHVNPAYAAAGPQRVPAADVEGVLQNIEQQIANDKTGLLAGRLGDLRGALTETPAVAGSPAVPPERVLNGASYRMVGGSPEVAPAPRVPLTDIENLDRVRKYFRDRMTQPPLGSDAFTKEQAAAVTSHLTNLDRIMEQVPEFAAGKHAFQQFTGAVNDPLTAGPLGAMANTPSVKAQTAALYPGIPTEGAPNETRLAMALLGNTAPGVAEDLTRQHIMNHLNESLSHLQGGQNQYAGAKLAVALAGNPEQAATLRSGLSALPGGTEHAQEMDSLLEALRATGKRQPPGSMTAFNESDLKDLHIAPFAQALGRLGDPLTWGAGLGDIINRANYRRNVNSLAQMLMAPPEETAATLEAARKAAKPSANPLLPALLGTHRGSP